MQAIVFESPVCQLNGSPKFKWNIKCDPGNAPFMIVAIAMERAYLAY